MLLLDAEKLEAFRPEASALHWLRAAADAALAAPIRTVLDKPGVPPSGDKHDYMSFGPYWWPDPETPDGLPYVRRDGEVNPLSERSDKPALRAMAGDVEVLALASHYLDEPRYGAGAVERVSAWFLDPATRMNPHLEFGQGIPGHCTGRGIGIIDTAPLRLLPDLMHGLQSETSWTAREHAQLLEWFAAYLDWLLTSDHGQDEARQHNNHGTFYDLQVVLFALATKQPEVARRTLERVPEVRFAPQIASDGAQPHELARTRSFFYAGYNLTAFFDLATLARHLDLDFRHWRGPQGQSLQSALEFLAAYADTSVPWPYPQIVEDDHSVLYALLRRAPSIYPEHDWLTAQQHAERNSRNAERVRLLWP